MGVIDYFRREATAAAAPEQKASATGKLVAMQAAGGRVAWTPRDAVSLTRNGFAGNPVGFRVVKLIAEAAAALPLILQDSARRYEEHPLLSLLRKPNTAQGRAELLEAFYGQLLLTGNGYIEAVAAEEGAPVELHVLRSDRMSLVPGADGWPVAFDYTVNGRKHRFDVSGARSPICHIKSFHPQDDHYGLSPMQAAATALDVHNSATRWSKALLDNAARPSGAIVYRGTGGDGTMTTGRPMLLEGGLDWKPMGFSPSDMEFQKTKESAARDIALAFGVPPMLLGIPGDATYANYQEANRAFYRLTVLPLATRVTAALGEWLERFTEEDLTLAPDLEQVPALSAEREALWKRVGEATFLSEAEKRAMLGLPPLDMSNG
ncbi:phage portal protein [Pseudooceanicola sp. HF7]|uniref:phage portal protein n=1 Tax=Pseudooceanicola sp. HF7 TaxID=2721560 RepID=UPI0014316359|nr:phage portal protein [Pseudooceanicola sp. HF7]NIZ10774.1 phage portal protein [Pseudooceanicola sp. HF7]